MVSSVEPVGFVARVTISSSSCMVYANPAVPVGFVWWWYTGVLPMILSNIIVMIKTKDKHLYPPNHHFSMWQYRKVDCCVSKEKLLVLWCHRGLSFFVSLLLCFGGTLDLSHVQIWTTPKFEPGPDASADWQAGNGDNIFDWQAGHCASWPTVSHILTGRQAITTYCLSHFVDHNKLFNPTMFLSSQCCCSPPNVNNHCCGTNTRDIKTLSSGKSPNHGMASKSDIRFSFSTSNGLAFTNQRQETTKQRTAPKVTLKTKIPEDKTNKAPEDCVEADKTGVKDHHQDSLKILLTLSQSWSFSCLTGAVDLVGTIQFKPPIRLTKAVCAFFHVS